MSVPARDFIGPVPRFGGGHVLVNPCEQLDAVDVLLQKALGLLHERSEMETIASDALRERLISKVQKMRLTLSMLRRELTIVSGLVNRKHLRKNNARPG
jgi:hypothetical protein